MKLLVLTNSRNCLESFQALAFCKSTFQSTYNFGFSSDYYVDNRKKVLCTVTLKPYKCFYYKCSKVKILYDFSANINSKIQLACDNGVHIRLVVQLPIIPVQNKVFFNQPENS